MFTRALIDPIAMLLLELRKVSGTQWVLRCTGLVGTALALLLTLPGGLFVHIGTTVVTAGVAGALLIQLLRPDSDLGLIGPGILVLVLAGQDDLSAVRALGVGLGLLLAHSAFSLAASIPLHGVFSRSAWQLGARSLLPVLALTTVSTLLVLALMGVGLWPWLLIPGVLAVVMLFVVLAPSHDSPTP